MAGSRKLLLDISSLGASNALGKLLWALSLALMMRALGPEDYGQLVVIWSLAGIVAPLTDLGLSQFLLREGARKASQAEHLPRLAFRIRLLLGAFAVTVIVVTWKLQESPDAGLPFAVLALAASAPLIDACFLTATAIAQVEGRIRSLAGWRLASFVALPLSLIVLLPRMDGITGPSIAYAGTSLLALQGFLFFGQRGRVANVVGTGVIEALRRSRPFLFVGLAAVSYGKVEVALLGLLSDKESAAFYHIAYQIILLVYSISEIFFTAIFAAMYRAGARPDELRHRWPTIRRVLCATAAVMFPLLWIHASDVMTVLGGPAFAGASHTLRALLPMVAVLPISAAFSFLMLLDRPHERAVIDAACVVATGLLVFLLAPRLGVVAAAISASAIYVATCLVAWLRVRAAGLRLDWLHDSVIAFLLCLPPALLAFIPWNHWWLGALAQLVASIGMIYSFGYLRPKDLQSISS